uniref:Uncharacterized protein n=1 Tax=Phlebotomus papatasi TaxID=29031 RepID=A0A1B0DBV7_PHLPP
MKIGLTFVPTIVPQNDTCYKRRDSLYSNFRQAFRDEYAAKFQKYPDDEELNETQKTKKLQVSVYYEALCVDSVYFFTRQLIPTYNEYGDKMDLKLIPYGKAS